MGNLSITLKIHNAKKKTFYTMKDFLNEHFPSRCVRTGGPIQWPPRCYEGYIKINTNALTDFLEPSLFFFANIHQRFNASIPHRSVKNGNNQLYAQNYNQPLSTSTLHVKLQ